jgi:acetyl xylan esterase AXE1
VAGLFPPLFLLTGLLLGQVPTVDSRNAVLHGPDTHFAGPRFESVKQWEVRRAYLQRRILTAAGLSPLPIRGALTPRLSRRYTGPAYTMDAVLLQTFPGYFVGGNLYQPVGWSGPRPVVLVPHGHWKHGRLENLKEYSVPALCIHLAKQGYVVYSWDMAGYNDTRQTSHGFGGRSEALWSFNPLGLQLWNSMRAVDFVHSLEHVDSKRVAVTGASGGGTQTFLLAAVDERVAYAAPVNMVSASMQGGDPCEEAPNLRLDSSNVEIAALMAPRPMLLISSTGDWTRNTPREEFPQIRAIYALYGRADAVQNIHFRAKHNYNQASREAFYRWLAAQSRRSPLTAEQLSESAIPPVVPAHYLALHPAGPPAGALTYSQLFREWKEAARRQNSEPGELRERLQQVLETEWPKETLAVVSGDRFVVSRPLRGDRVTGWWRAASRPPIVVVHPEGSGAARSHALVQQLLAMGESVVAIDPFTDSFNREARERFDRYFLSYNRSGDALRVQDILTVLSYVRSTSGAQPKLVGLGKAGLWCLFAAAVSPVPVELAADLDAYQGTDEEFEDALFVPGIQRVGGLRAALALTERSRVALTRWNLAALRRAAETPSE